MAASTRRQSRVNVDVAVAVSRRRSRRRFLFLHVSRSRSPASSLSLSSSSSVSSNLSSLNVFLRRINLKQIVKTLIILVMWQRIKDVHQANMKRELKQKLQRLEAQSTALNQLKNNSQIKDIINQMLNTIFSSNSCIQTMIFYYFFIDIIQLILIFKNEFWAVNIFKLINDHILNSINKQDLQLSWIDELQAHDDDVTQQNLKNMILFLCCLKVYNQCFIKMINDQLKYFLQVSLV